MGRKLIINERTEMHLVLDKASGRLYVKPIPATLFIPRFWNEYLTCAQGCECHGKKYQLVVDEPPEGYCTRRRMRMVALGLLYSYAALISYESDFYIAKEAHLLPACIDWPQWQHIVYQLDTDKIYHRIHPRFIYGELRSIWLDLALVLTAQRFRSHFGGDWDHLSARIWSRISFLAPATIFIGLVLSAMQVGHNTPQLEKSGAFQEASYVFSIFSILFLPFFFAFFIPPFCLQFLVRDLGQISSDKKREEHLYNSQKRSRHLAV